MVEEKVMDWTKAPTVDQLSKLGFKKAAAKTLELKGRQRKLAIAYEHYRFVKQSHVDAFNAKIRLAGNYLAFTSIDEYEGVPPGEVLSALELAHERNCFDAFEVAHIERIPDPILFGRIKGCSDRFYIGQWDSDVSIDDLLKKNEG